MPELIWIVDPTTGDLTVEGLDVEKALALASDLLPPPRELNCAQPLTSTRIPLAIASDEPTLRVAALWHGSVVEGPGDGASCKFRVARCAAAWNVRSHRLIRLLLAPCWRSTYWLRHCCTRLVHREMA